MPVYTDTNGYVVFDPTNGRINNSEFSPYPNIVTDGLLLWLDGYDAPVSGQWLDISGNNNNFTLGGGTSQDGSTNGGVYRIGTSTTDTLYISTNIINNIGAYTLMTAGRYLSTSGNGRIFSNMGGAINWVLHWGNLPEYLYANNWYLQQGSADTNWRISVVSNNTSYTNGKIKFNDVNQTLTSTSNMYAPFGFSIGNYSDGTNFSEHSNCEVGFVLMYNRQLTDAETTQNFNAYKDRYGL